MIAVLEDLQEAANHKIREILEEEVVNPEDPEDPDFKMKHFYRQCLDLKQINEDGINAVILFKCTV